MDFKWLVFDLGGVLVEYIGGGRLKGWMRHPVNDVELSRLWLFSPTVRALESGRLGGAEFARDIIEELDLDVPIDMFLEEFPGFVTGYYPGAEEMLTTLSAKLPLAMLSNTNSLQWERLIQTTSTASLFRRVFLSFRTGYLKPDRDAFAFVIKELGCEPGQIVFFDDNPANVRGALDVGIYAVHVMGFEDMRQIITGMGLL
jgi:glucose-1-phosphatase